MGTMRRMMVKDLMTDAPICVEPSTPLHEAARLMVEHDCGELPVVENFKTMAGIGVITDRDITCRAVANGLDPTTTTVEQCMTSPIVTINPDDSLQDCLRLLEKHQIRRMIVADHRGHVCGIVSQADVVQSLDASRAAEVVRSISKHSAKAAHV